MPDTSKIQGSVRPAIQTTVVQPSMTARSFVGRLAQHLWVPAAYLALTLVLTWPLAAQPGSTLLGTIDPQLQAWNLAWDVHALSSNPASLWQAPIFFPYPDTLAYADNFILLSFLAAPVLWLTSNHVLALNLLVLLSFVLTGWAVYDLAQDVMGDADSRVADRRSWIVEHVPAFLAGAAFAFGAYRLGHIVHLNLLQTMWLPWSLLFLRRLLRPSALGGGRWRDALLCGMFAGLQGATAIYYSFFAAAVLGGYTGLWTLAQLWGLVRQREQLPWRIAGRVLVAAAVAGLIAGPFFLFYARVYETLGIVRSVRELDNWSAPLRAYAATPGTNLWHRLVGLPFEEAGEFTLFPGLLVSILGIVALLSKRWLMFRDRLFWGLVIVGAFVLSLGTGLRWERGGDALPVPLPYIQLYNHLPGFGALRVPARWGMLVALALSVLAGVTLTRLLAGLRGSRQLLVGTLALILVLGETVAAPFPRLDPALVANVPPIYRWLGAPTQADIDVVLELPAPKVPRGADLERISWRQFYAVYHWKRLPVAFSGLIPFGITDLLGIIQRLPDQGTLHYLQLVGVDTLVIHTDEYDVGKLAKLVAAFDQSPLVRLRAEVGAARVYTLIPSQELAEIAPRNGGESILISDNEQVPGMLALALKRHWEEQGFTLYGRDRVRYYGPLATPQPGQVFDYGLLAADEDPVPYGFTPTDKRWNMNGLAFYVGDPAQRVNLDLGHVQPGMFHATFPSQLALTIQTNQLQAGNQIVTWSKPVTKASIELDVASLHQQTLDIGGHSFIIPSGGSTVVAPIDIGQPFIINGNLDTTAILRLRLRSGSGGAATTAAGKLAASVAVTFTGAQLHVKAHVAGAGDLALDVWGASAYDDKPVHLLQGAQPIAATTDALTFDIDVLAPTAAWLQQSAPPVDGRYLVYLRSATQSGERGIPIAKFTIRNGAVVDAEPVPLPLTWLPR